MRDNEYGRVVYVYNNGRTVGAIRSFPAPDHGWRRVVTSKNIVGEKCRKFRINGARWPCRKGIRRTYPTAHHVVDRNVCRYDGVRQRFNKCSPLLVANAEPWVLELVWDPNSTHPVRFIFVVNRKRALPPFALISHVDISTAVVVTFPKLIRTVCTCPDRVTLFTSIIVEIRSRDNS